MCGVCKLHPTSGLRSFSFKESWKLRMIVFTEYYFWKHFFLFMVLGQQGEGGMMLVSFIFTHFMPSVTRNITYHYYCLALLALRTMRPLLLVIVCYHLLSIVGSLQNQDNLAPFIYVPRACLFFFSVTWSWNKELWQ